MTSSRASITILDLYGMHNATLHILKEYIKRQGKEVTILQNYDNINRLWTLNNTEKFIHKLFYSERAPQSDNILTLVCY